MDEQKRFKVLERLAECEHWGYPYGNPTFEQLAEVAEAVVDQHLILRAIYKRLEDMRAENARLRTVAEAAHVGAQTAAMRLTEMERDLSGLREFTESHIAAEASMSGWMGDTENRLTDLESRLQAG